jgi:putative flippase GtrA
MAQQIKNDRLGSLARSLSPSVFDLYSKYRRILTYIVSGSTGAFVNLFSLFILTHVFEIWYLLASVLAFCLAFSVSFYMQKYWTFRDVSNDGIHKQISLYFVIQLGNLLINTGFMYFFVDVIGETFVIGHPTWLVMLSQFVTSGLIAIESYFLYRVFIFNNS